MRKLFSLCRDSIRQRKLLFIITIIIIVLVVVLAIFSAVNFDNGVLPISLSNIAYMRYLRGESGVAYFIFSTILSIAIFYIIMVVCCFKRCFVLFAFVFYFYFIFSQIVIFVSVIMLYGFFSTLILLILLLFYLFVVFTLLLLILLQLLNFSNTSFYFKNCFGRKDSYIMVLTIVLLVFLIVFCIVMMLLKSFIILLIF